MAQMEKRKLARRRARQEDQEADERNHNPMSAKLKGSVMKNGVFQARSLGMSALPTAAVATMGTMEVKGV